MIAVVRDQHAGGLRRLEDRRAVRYGDRPALDREVHHLHVRHQATCAGTMCTFFFLMSASKSPRNFCIPDATGVAHESLSTQMVLPVMFSASSSRVSRSSVAPSPATIRSRIFVVHAVPSRHCVHCARSEEHTSELQSPVHL